MLPFLENVVLVFLSTLRPSTGKGKRKKNQMEQEGILESPSPLPVIPRLDRMDRLLQFLEEKHCSARKRYTGQGKPEDEQVKTLSSALEEVHHKGTLMERVAILENRVLQLSLEMEEGRTSGSSSSTIADRAQTDTASSGQAEAFTVATEPRASHKRRRQKAVGPLVRQRKCLAWFPMGC